MTVSSVYEPVQYTGNGVTTAFAFPYIFYDDTDIIVTLTLISTGVDSVQVNPTNYTLTGGDGATGTVNFVAAPSALYRVTIERSIPYTQEDNYVEGQAFPAQTIETAFDRGVMRDQQINATLERALSYPATISGIISAALPTPEDGKALVFDGTTGAIVASDSVFNDIVSDAEAAAAIAVANAAITTADAASTEEDRIAAEAAAANLSGTSASSVLIATGAKSFTTQSGKTFSGQFLKISSAANQANYMFGNVTSYSGTALVMNITAIGGTGTFSDWLIAVSGAQGPTGATGPAGSPGAGTGDVVGPVSVTSGRIAVWNGTSGDLLAEAAGIYGTMASQNSNGVSITAGTITGITDIAVADGGTGASDAATARTNLGLGNVANVDSTVATNITSGTVATARLGSGTANSTSYLRGDQTWSVPGLVTSMAVGAYLIARYTGGGSITDNGTTAGSNLKNMTISTTGTIGVGSISPSGTWRNMSGDTIGTSAYGLWQRTV